MSKVNACVTLTMQLHHTAATCSYTIQQLHAATSYKTIHPTVCFVTREDHHHSRVILILMKFGILISTWFQVVPFCSQISELFLFLLYDLPFPCGYFFFITMGMPNMAKMAIYGHLAIGP